MYFFTFRSNLPDGTGFRHFGPIHLLWLLAIAVLLILLSLWYRRLGQDKKKKLLLGLGVLLCVMLAAEFLIVAATGHMSVYRLPLQFCEISPVLCLLYVCFHWDWVGQTVYSLSGFGALVALLFPNWNMYPQWNYVNISGFLIHGGILLFWAWMLLCGDFRPRMIAMWKPMLFLLIISPVIYRLNIIWGTNYFFMIADAPNSPLTILYQVFGKQGYIPSYAVMVFIVMLVEYLPWRHERKGKKEAVHR